MLGKAHMAIGGAIGLLICDPAAGGPTAIAAIFVASLAAGLPDVLDSENAAGREPLLASWSGIKRDARRKRKSLIETVLLLPRALLAVCLDIVAKLLPHRGLTHWLLTWAFLSVLLGALSSAAGWGSSIPIAFSLGYLSHLLTDALTVSGVEIFAPFCRKPIRLLPSGLRFRYDSPVQWLIVLAAWGAVLWIEYPQLAAIVGGWL